jgi:hypothetical protein
MTRRITAAAVASIAAMGGIASVATADSGHSATPYRAALAPVNPAAATAGLATVTGKAQLVDGKKNNKVSLHVRNLAPMTTYLWQLQDGTCAAPGAPVPGWTYRTQDSAGNGTLTSNEAGNANTKAKSATFDADPALSYSVSVQLAPAGPVIACGDLTPNKAAGKSDNAGGKSGKAGGNGKRPERVKGPNS